MQKKVLFIHHGGIDGGAPLSMLYTARGVSKYDYIPIVGLVKNIPELHELYNKAGYETFNIPEIPMLVTWSASEGKRWNPYTWKGIVNVILKWNKGQDALLRSIKKYDISLVHLNSVLLSNSASALLKNNIPFVWHVREQGPKHKGLRYKFIRNLLLKASSVIFLSQDEQASWVSDSGHGSVVHNFIDFDQFDYDYDSKRINKTYGFSSDDRVLLYVGGMKKHKGIVPLVEAINMVKAQYPNIKCFMLDSKFPVNKGLKSLTGLFNNKSRLNRLVHKKIQQYSLEDNIILLPFNPDIVEYFAASEVIIFPALKPHFSRPIIEAGAMKKPVIAFNVSVINELVEDNITGVLVELDNSNKLSEAIIKLISNKDLCDSMGEEGYKKAKQNFNFDIQIKKIIDVYENELES